MSYHFKSTYLSYGPAFSSIGDNDHVVFTRIVAYALFSAVQYYYHRIVILRQRMNLIQADALLKYIPPIMESTYTLHIKEGNSMKHLYSNEEKFFRITKSYVYT